MELVKIGISINDILSPTGDPNSGTWRCNMSPDGKYTVRSLRRKFDNINFTVMPKFDWIKEIPKKVLCFFWRAKMGRIPTAAALCRRGVVNHNQTVCS